MIEYTITLGQNVVVLIVVIYALTSVVISVGFGWLVWWIFTNWGDNFANALKA